MSAKKILYTVLDWGLGHATRSKPVISHLIAEGHHLILAGNGRSLLILKQSFPEIEIIEVPGIRFTYPAHALMWMHMAVQIPDIVKSINQEHAAFHKIIREKKPDMIISDHRYGAFDKEIPSFFIGHQLRLQLPKPFHFFEDAIWKQHLKYLRAFDEIWIPDVEDEHNLSGELAHHPAIKQALNIKYLGNLSSVHRTSDRPQRYEIAAIISGPEPQRSLFEKKITDVVQRIQSETIIVRGLPGSDSQRKSGKLTVVDYMSSSEISALLESVPILICRPGYSTIMDLSALQKNAIVIPTPGQTEQEYLAEYHSLKKHVVSSTQKDFKIEKLIKEVKYCLPFPVIDTQRYKNVLNEVVASY